MKSSGEILISFLSTKFVLVTFYSVLINFCFLLLSCSILLYFELSSSFQFLFHSVLFFPSLFLPMLNHLKPILYFFSSQVTNNHQPKDYSHSLYSQIPIKYLIQQARNSQVHYRDLYPPLLRLLVTYYPQLCLVEDWLCEEDGDEIQTQGKQTSVTTNLNIAVVMQGE